MADFVQQLVEELARKVAGFGGTTGWIDQRESIMGRNRHCAAVRRRIAEGLEGASIIGRRCLLTPAALREEMQRHMVHPKPGPAKTSPVKSGVTSQKPDPQPSEEQKAFDTVMAKVRSLRGA